MRPAVALLLSLAVSAAFAEKQDFSYYQSIIDREMFGATPKGFDPTKSPNDVKKMSSKEEMQLAQEKEKLQSAIHFSVINVASDGQPEVGFTDNSDPKVPKHYFMKVGETRDGWMVKKADAENATMTIAKGEIEVSLTLGGNSAKGGEATSRAGGATTLPASISKGGVWSPGRRTGGELLGSTLRAKHLRRKQEEQEARDAERQAQAAREQERQVREEQEKQQRDAERAETWRQLQDISEQIRKNFEAKNTAAKGEDGGEGGANNDAE